MKKDFQWVDSDGTPMVLFPLGRVSSWPGVNFPLDYYEENKISFESAYNDICNVDGYVDTIIIDDFQVLVFGDEPLSITFWKDGETSDLLFARWVYGDNIYDVQMWLSTVSMIKDWQKDCEIYINEGSAIVFDVSISGNDAYREGLIIDIPVGCYSVYTCQYKPDDRTSLIINRMVLHLEDLGESAKAP